MLGNFFLVGAKLPMMFLKIASRVCFICSAYTTAHWSSNSAELKKRVGRQPPTETLTYPRGCTQYLYVCVCVQAVFV